MSSTKPVIAIQTEKSTIKKFEHIAKENGRSMSKEAEQAILKIIWEYEAKHGPIKIEE